MLDRFKHHQINAETSVSPLARQGINWPSVNYTPQRRDNSLNWMSSFNKLGSFGGGAPPAWPLKLPPNNERMSPNPSRSSGRTSSWTRLFVQRAKALSCAVTTALIISHVETREEEIEHLRLNSMRPRVCLQAG